MLRENLRTVFGGSKDGRRRTGSTPLFEDVFETRLLCSLVVFSSVFLWAV